MYTVRSESLKKPDGRSELRRAGFISGNKRESGANEGRLGLLGENGANQGRLGLAQLFFDQGF